MTGSHSGPEFDKLIPILEEGSRLNLPKHVLSVRERVEEFARARAQASDPSVVDPSESPLRVTSDRPLPQDLLNLGFPDADYNRSLIAGVRCKGSFDFAAASQAKQSLRSG